MKHPTLQDVVGVVLFLCTERQLLLTAWSLIPVEDRVEYNPYANCFML